MDFWVRGKRMALTIIVKRMTAIPTSPPGIIQTQKSNAL